MPWCETCSKFWNPTSMTAAGECPACGRVIADPAKVATATATAAGTATAKKSRVPWHFWLLLIALVIYLGFRAYQGVAWLTHHL